MAGAKKKKKPAANPARGFATTSVASKPRPEANEDSASTVAQSTPATLKASVGATAAQPSDATEVPGTNRTAGSSELTPEEFERQLEESELQLLVERHAQKARRDASRQCTRLETDRRLLRGQAEPINTRKWLSDDLMDHILDLIKGESRFAPSNPPSDAAFGSKMLPEEDLIIRLWTLQQSLAGAGFPAPRVKSAVRYILDVSPNIASTTKDSVWGLDEAMDWLARECPLDELPEYEGRPKPAVKAPGESCLFL